MEIIMSDYEDNVPDACVWKDLFDNDERIILQDGFLITGLLSVMFSLWLSVTILFTNLRFDDSYRNLANFTLAECFRHSLPAFYHLPLIEQFKTPQVYGFFETLLAVFEIECLTHVCIERYVFAKYISNGWPINKNHYNLYLCLCVFFSVLYSVPPLFGIGNYGYDFDCTSYTFDMILPNNWKRYIVVAIFFLRSVKPTVFMTMMLIWAQILERKFSGSIKSPQQFTKSVIVITLVNLLCCAPIALIRASVVLSHLMYVDLIPLHSGNFIMWAMWIHWVAPVPTAIALILSDERVRNKTFFIYSTESEVQIENQKKD